MTDTDIPLPGSEADEVVAIEWAFGLLEPSDRIAAERQAAAEPAFAELCQRWQTRARALLEGREEQPSPALWNAIARRLPANDPAVTVRRWQAATAAAASLALVLGAALALSPGGEPRPAPIERVSPERPLVAVLASAERDAVVAVSFDPVRRQVSALPRRLATDGREAQLWVIPTGGKPVAAGLLLPGARTALVTGSGVASLIVPGATLAVSLEPRGGSRTGAPTGPVILTGTVARS